MAGSFVERFSLTGKRALVTGASKGIGLEICRVLADAGADVAAVARDAAGLAEARADVEAHGRRCLVIAADMATVEGPRATARTALEVWGGIDILVNNAGIAVVEASWSARSSTGTWSRRSICAHPSCSARRWRRA